MFSDEYWLKLRTIMRAENKPKLRLIIERAFYWLPLAMIPDKRWMVWYVLTCKQLFQKVLFLEQLPGKYIRLFVLTASFFAQQV